MNRLGFGLEDTKDSHWIATLKALQAKGYRLGGVMSHLACGELEPEVFSQHQATCFQDIVSRLLSLGFQFQWVHFENGAASSWSQEIQKGPWNAVRPGLALYGIDSRVGVHDLDWLEPVLQVSGPLRQTIRVKPGESIGYGRAYMCSTEHVIGIVSLGYADGLDRMLSRFEGQEWAVGLTWKGCRVPFVGKISMDLCAVDLTKIPASQRPQPGQHLDWIGHHQSVSEIAKATGRIPWEILCSIDHRLKRVEVSQ
jgi:alanine racemase